MMMRFIFLRSVRVQRFLFVSLFGFIVAYYVCSFYLWDYGLDLETITDYEDQVCHQPKLDINNSEIMKFMEYQPPLKCSDDEDWVQIEGSTVKITEAAKKKYGDVKCKFVDIMRSSDFGTFLGHETTTHTEHDLEESDFFRVYCQTQSGKKWENRMAGARLDNDILERVGWEYVPKDGLKLNVLMFGFDSMSRMTFMRKLPKSYSKLKSLGAIVLEGYNIIGDGTPQALIPILTGKTELEMPDTRKRMGSKASHVNVYPFIWNDFRKFGYVTGYMEDMPNAGVFTYRLKGFHSEPTDHYMRTWYVDSQDHFRNNKPYCMGSLPRHKVMMDYAKHIYTVYPNKPKFIFGFHGELSHDSFNLIGAADDDVVEWIEWFEKRGYLNDTLLIMMSDHGHRFADVRNTQQGKLEERLPFFSFTFPSWFKNKYPEAYSNFRDNVHRLTTPFDVHKTLKNVLNFEGPGVGTLDERGISLFRKIPKQRSCRDAEIEPHWCACLVWQTIDFNTKIIHRAAKEFVEFLNQYNSQFTNLCKKLDLDSIRDAAKLLPNKRVLTFKGSLDVDGHLPDLTNKIRITSDLYQIRVKTTPGNGLFEFSSIYDRTDDRFIFQIQDVSRINKYGDDSLCIYDNQEQLRKYCYCKK
ncbi:uncharacterized protein LOC135843428 [Planococcus citri]|uniref:uncharacterized protein LOC135843428 n=1 Tax=Planococcus citri TaxID=170843 RepID=UPI0031F73092